MGWYWWVLIVVVGGSVVWRFLPTAVGASIKVGDAARFYLSAELKKHGVRHLIPDQCIWEVADGICTHWKEMAELDNQSDTWVKTEMIPHLTLQGRLIVCWLNGDSGMERFEDLTTTLKKYGVPFGAESRR
jgi:hypothetical protein